MIAKTIEAIPGESWVSVVEYPDGSLVMSGVFLERTINAVTCEPTDAFRTTAIRFSLEAVKALIPLMQEWVDQPREKEPF